MASASQNSQRSSKIDKALIDQFCMITGGDPGTAKNLLEACAGNLDMAVGMHLDSGTANTPAAAENGASDYAPPPPDDSVRAPIPQREEVLVEEPIHGIRSRRRAAQSVFDGFRDFQAEARQQELGLAAPSGDRSSKKRTLEDLFRPPLELLHKGSFHSARDSGSSENRWLLVNIQDVKEFQCQALNRDVWSHPAVKSIIQERFIFWQVYCDSEEGQKYMQFYKVVEWPYIAVLDPQTGENLVTWHKVDAVTFCDLVTDFLATHPSPNGTISPPSKRQKREDSIIEASEDSQMEAAIQASLETSHNTTRTESSDSESSDDELETFSDSDDNAPAPVVTNKEVVPSKKDKSKKDSSKRLKNKSSKNSDSVMPADETTSSSIASTGSAGNNCEEVASVASLKTNGEQVGQNTSSAHISQTNGEQSWKEYLGNDNDPKCDLIFRFPCGKRKKLSLPNSSKLMALVQFMISEGCSNERYELVTTYPRRRLSHLEPEDTLVATGLQKQETIFVQER